MNVTSTAAVGYSVASLLLHQNLCQMMVKSPISQGDFCFRNAIMFKIEVKINLRVKRALIQFTIAVLSRSGI